MPPEVHAGGVHGKAGDVYAFGVCLWELATEAWLWAGFDKDDVVAQVKRGERPSQDKLKDKGTPAALVAMMQKGAGPDEEAWVCVCT